MLCDPWRKNLLRAAARGSEPRASVVLRWQFQRQPQPRERFFWTLSGRSYWIQYKKISSMRKGKCANLLPPQGGLHAILTLFRSIKAPLGCCFHLLKLSPVGERQPEGVMAHSLQRPWPRATALLPSFSQPNTLFPHQTAGNLSSEPFKLFS